MENFSEKRSTTLPLPSSPHCAPRTMMLPMLVPEIDLPKTLHCTVCGWRTPSSQVDYRGCTRNKEGDPEGLLAAVFLLFHEIQDVVPINLAFREEAIHRFNFVLIGFEGSVQLERLRKAGLKLTQVQQHQLAARFTKLYRPEHQRAQAGAIDVGNIFQIQDDVVAAGVQKTLQPLTKRKILRAQAHAAFEVKDEDSFFFSWFNIELHHRDHRLPG